MVYRVIKDYTSTQPEHWIVQRGDRLATETRKTIYSGWTWCVKPSGEGAWVPDEFFAREGAGAVMLRDYDAYELSAREGDQVTGTETAAGWVLCFTEADEVGWLPLEYVQEMTT